MTMIRIRDLRTGFTYRSAWTGFAKGGGLNISNAPILHSARIGADRVYEDPFKRTRHGFSEKYEQFLKALRSLEHALVRHGGRDETGKMFGTGKLIAIYEILSHEIDAEGGVMFRLGQRIAS
ncbi:hypothetical protein LX81_04061 [Palleronia aestuarii]|uniref:Uncharacterized protein n=1 Tax=Palleronia aestuarii TaxID=568105 RepID=A0A2W7MS70_9RHOB|nr:hypothetical protein [Palleronia aestuarii]PZX10995.1 hypothetical protein LX81_04061 [Palleronia aestuarii]